MNKCDNSNSKYASLERINRVNSVCQMLDQLRKANIETDRRAKAFLKLGSNRKKVRFPHQEKTINQKLNSSCKARPSASIFNITSVHKETRMNKEKKLKQSISLVERSKSKKNEEQLIKLWDQKLSLREEKMYK